MRISSDQLEKLFGARNILADNLFGADLDEAGGGAVGAGEPFAVGHGFVHHQVDGRAFGEDGRQDCRRADFDAGVGAELIGRSE